MRTLRIHLFLTLPLILAIIIAGIVQTIYWPTPEHEVGDILIIGPAGKAHGIKVTKAWLVWFGDTPFPRRAWKYTFQRLDESRTSPSDNASSGG